MLGPRFSGHIGQIRGSPWGTTEAEMRGRYTGTRAGTTWVPASAETTARRSPERADCSPAAGPLDEAASCLDLRSHRAGGETEATQLVRRRPFEEAAAVVPQSRSTYGTSVSITRG